MSEPKNIAVMVEVLNTQDAASTTFNAALRHLDGEQAILSLPASVSHPRLHWGSRVRFRLGSGAAACELTGMVVAPAIGSLDAVEAEAQQLLLLRLWECRMVHQRRQSARQSARFRVLYRALTPPAANTNLPVPCPPDKTPVEAEHWLSGWCVDIGGGGLRLRADCDDVPAGRLLVQFALPVNLFHQTLPPALSREFTLQARVLRTIPLSRSPGKVEIALSFTNLSAEDSLALARFVAAK